MADRIDLPQDPGDTQLPGRGDMVTLNMEGEPTRDVTLLLYDSAMDVWAVHDEASGELMLIRLDADLTWRHVSLDLATDADTLST